MRKNLPVTDTEKRFSESTQLTTSTDTKGIITDCNEAFVQISGYTREELIGQPHNLIRHPDMPPAAFDIMWTHLKAGLPWMGLVKNRTKSGDYYWVNAYVTPITDSGRTIGYESVRVCPKREDVARAERVYSRLLKGQKVKPKPANLPEMALLIGGLVVGTGLALAGQSLVAQLVLGVTAVSLFMFGRQQHRQQLQALMDESPRAFRHPVTALTYTDDDLMMGMTRVGVMSEQSHLNTVLSRIDEVSRRVSAKAEVGMSSSQDCRNAAEQQQRETEQVATAMHEMTATISEVSQNVQHTAQQASESNQLAESGLTLSRETRDSIEQLRETVSNIADAVRDLDAQTGNITQAAGLIEQIAEQTNLLALNAAIEAARAGEHGRGFAVVADEVRNLAQKTRESTREIHSIVEALTGSADRSVKIANQGMSKADEGLTNVVKSEEMLGTISTAMNTIAGMAIQMSAAVEEQAQVSEEINQQVARIFDLSTDSLSRADMTTGVVAELKDVSLDMGELVQGFKR
ncbi:methyl-accepting chemotaxis protein [Pontibacter sp. JAM-7]|uniref:methyl-accepting chemotaxis protein n=1 Tax=Pontibacter sp. JAM-7 TaxID=3366581 RepID=UPI003AF669A3